VAQAVQSALNQTLSKNLYEIILTKNFSTSFDEEWSKKDGVRIRLHPCHLHSVYQCMNSSRKSTSGVKGVFFGFMLL